MDDWDSISAVKPQVQSQSAGQDWNSISSVKPAKPDQLKTEPEVGTLQAAQSGAEDALLFGLKDEAFAGLDAVAQPVFGTGNAGDSISDRYDKNLVDQRAFLKSAQDQHPVANIAGGIVGAIAPVLATGGGSLAGSAVGTAGKATLAGTAAKGAALGTAQGGAYGFGSAEGDFSDRAQGAGEGALVGATVGAAAPLVISGVAGAARKLVPDRFLPSTSPGPRLAEGVDQEVNPAVGPTSPGGSFVADTQGKTPQPPGAAPVDSSDPALRGTAKSIVDAVNVSGKNGEVALGNLAGVVDPDPKVISAINDLGLDVNDFTPAQLSQNPTFRNIQGALAAIPGSALNEKNKATYLKVAQKADDFINDFGGNTDKAAFSDEFARNGKDTIDRLGSQADKLYSYINEQIPSITRSPVENTTAYLNQKVADLGGESLLSSRESQALNVLSPKTITEPAGALSPGEFITRTENPTYAALDLVRQQVGQGYENAGPFRDMQSGIRDALYGALTKDQEALVNSMSPELGVIYQGAKSIVAQRKELESGLQSVLGRNLSGSIATSLGSSVKQLGQGNFKNFDNIIKHIPEKDRQAAIVTALNDAFTAKSGSQQQLSASGFVDWYGDLNRNNAARARLTKYLPAEATDRLDKIYTVAKAMKSASAEVVKTGVSLGVLKDYAAEGGLLSRIWDIARPAAAAEGITSSVGLPGVGAVGVIASALSKQKTPIQESASELLASPQLMNMIKAYSSSGGQLKANVLAREKQLVRTQAYRSWEKSLGSSARARIATVGPLVYLTEPSAPKSKAGPMELPATIVTP